MMVVGLDYGPSAGLATPRAPKGGSTKMSKSNLDATDVFSFGMLLMFCMSCFNYISDGKTIKISKYIYIERYIHTRGFYIFISDKMTGYI